MAGDEGLRAGSRRNVKAPSRFDGDSRQQRHRRRVKYVYRLLRTADVSDSLVTAIVFVLWPDDGTWYRARVDECNPEEQTATLYYETTDEVEEGTNLAELIADGQIAFKEPRRLDHVCKEGEIEVDPEAAAAAAAALAAGGTGGLEDWEDDELESDEEGEEEGVAGDEGSDPSVSSRDLLAGEDLEAGAGGSGGRRRQRRAEDSDEEVQLEEFEKRELMRDASDDEKPLGYRMTELEKQKQRQARQQARQAGGSSAGGMATGAAASRRRAASAGVAAATAAVKAVVGAGKPAQQKAGRPVDEEEAAEAAAQELLARATGSGPSQKAAAPGAFYGREGSGRLDRRLSGGGQQVEEDVRDKVRSGFKQALELAVSEAGGDSAAEAGAAAAAAAAEQAGGGDPGEVATAVEAALLALFGGTTKDYKSKYRTLQFNLKDPHNPDLRAAVLRGDIAPDHFVRMTATELANKELAEYRKKKEEEALKMSVLDAEAAARFSTAAALDARDKLAIPPSVAGDKLLAARSPSPERKARAAEGRVAGSPPAEPNLAAAGSADLATAGSGQVLSPSSHAEVGHEASGMLLPVGEGARAAAAPGESAASPRAAAAAPAVPAIDWASVKAAAVAASTVAEPPVTLLPSFDSFDQYSSKHPQALEKAAAADEYDPAAPALGLAPLAPGPAEHAERGAALRHLFSTPSDPTALFGRSVWEGQWTVPGAGAFLVSIDALAGASDMAALLGEQEPEVRGRLALSKLERFLLDLRRSRSRTVTVGVLRPAAGATEAERAALRELIAQYGERDRTGVAEPSPGSEAYLLPPGCSLVSSVVRAARAAAPQQVESVLPGGDMLSDDQMLVVVIHKRDWRPPPNFARPVKRPRLHPTPGEAAPSAAAPGAIPAAPPPLHPAPQLPPVPVIPPGPTAAPAALPAATAPPSAAGAPAAPAPPLALPVNIDWASLASALQTVKPAGQEGGAAAGAAAPAVPPAPAPPVSAAPPPSPGGAAQLTPPPGAASQAPAVAAGMAGGTEGAAAAAAAAAPAAPPLMLPDLSGLMALLPQQPEAPPAAPAGPAEPAAPTSATVAQPPAAAPAPLQLPDLSGLMMALLPPQQPAVQGGPHKAAPAPAAAAAAAGPVPVQQQAQHPSPMRRQQPPGPMQPAPQEAARGPAEGAGAPPRKRKSRWGEAAEEEAEPAAPAPAPAPTLLPGPPASAPMAGPGPMPVPPGPMGRMQRQQPPPMAQPPPQQQQFAMPYGGPPGPGPMVPALPGPGPMVAAHPQTGGQQPPPYGMSGPPPHFNNGMHHPPPQQQHMPPPGAPGGAQGIFPPPLNGQQHQQPLPDWQQPHPQQSGYPPYPHPQQQHSHPQQQQPYQQPQEQQQRPALPYYEQQQQHWQQQGGRGRAGGRGFGRGRGRFEGGGRFDGGRHGGGRRRFSEGH